jgi:hypothetical protein
MLTEVFSPQAACHWAAPHLSVPAQYFVAGIARTLLHWLTPSLPLTLLVGMIAGGLLVGGSTAALILLLVTLLLHQLSARARKESATMAAAQEALQQARAAAAVARRAAAEATAGGVGVGVHACMLRSWGVKAPSLLHPIYSFYSHSSKDT